MFLAVQYEGHETGKGSPERVRNGSRNEYRPVLGLASIHWLFLLERRDRSDRKGPSGKHSPRAIGPARSPPKSVFSETPWQTLTVVPILLTGSILDVRSIANGMLSRWKPRNASMNRMTFGAVNLDRNGIENRPSSETSVLHSRRVWMRRAIAFGCAVAGAMGRSRSASALETTSSTPTHTFRVKSVLELRGEVRLKAQGNTVARKNGKQVVARTAPVHSTSTLEYEEQYRLGTIDDAAGIQHFSEANSEITVDQHTTKTTLREPCREIVRLGTSTGLITTAPAAPLFTAEQDLVDGTVNSMFIDQILTEKEVSITDKWTVDDTMTCRLLNLDAVQEGKLVVCLVDSNEKQAQLQLDGKLTALVRDVATELTITGKAVLERSEGYVSWLALQIEETREIGEAEPGFKIQAQIRVRREAIDRLESGRSLEEVLEDTSIRTASSLLQYQSDLGFYRFLADRRWSTYRDNGEEATLRFIVNNRLVAQCNVMNLVDYEAGVQLSLEGFQSDIQRLVSKTSGEILEAAEMLSSTSHRVLRIAASGQTEGVPIRWIHYHISNDDGRRLSLVFMLDEESIDVFAEQDAQIVNSLELLAWPSKLDQKALDDAATQTESRKEEAAAPSKSASVKPTAKKSR